MKTNIKHLFVSYDIAKQLKEKGFDEPCLAWHLWDGTELNKEFKDKVSQPLYSPKTNTEFQEAKHIGAPLYQQVIDWFREQKQIEINVFSVKPFVYGYSFEFMDAWSKEDKSVALHILDQVLHSEKKESVGKSVAEWEELRYSYYEALDKAMEEALKLI